MKIDVDSFFASWQNKTPQEVECIKQLKRALIFLCEQSVLDKTVSIYLVGSFLRREMRQGSDVDLKIVIRDDSDLDYFIRLQKLIDEATKGAIGVTTYSLEQLIRGKFKSDETKASRTPPAYFVKYLPIFMLLYGRALSQSDFATISDENEIIGLGSFVLTQFTENWGPKDPERIRMIAKQGLFVLMIEDRIQSKIPTHQSRSEFVKKFGSDAFIQRVWQLARDPSSLDSADLANVLTKLKGALQILVSKYKDS